MHIKGGDLVGIYDSLMEYNRTASAKAKVCRDKRRQADRIKDSFYWYTTESIADYNHNRKGV